MHHDHRQASLRILAAQPRHKPLKLAPTVLILCITGVVWGCAGRTGAPATTAYCPGTIQAKVSAAKPTVKVSYREPSVTAAGELLSDLVKTTIYYDLGNGRRLAKEVPATRPTGGGQISETITLPVQSQGEQSARICVTATDRQGNESRTTR